MATACIAQVAFGFEPKGKPVVALFDRRTTAPGRRTNRERTPAPKAGRGCHGSESRGCRTGRSAREPEPSSTRPSRVVRLGREAARAPSRKHSRGPRPQARRYESRVEIHSVV
jgi:hypothetical protein